MRKLTIQELGRPNQSAFQASVKNEIVVVLDNVRSGLNVGSIFRTADAFAISKIVLCGITPQPPHREILKTALGATQTVDWKYFPHCVDAIRELQADGYVIWPVEQTDSSVMLDEIQRASDSDPIAVIFGNEVSGISESVIELFDQSIEIPQFGTKHSMNVAVSAGIVLWHLLYARHRIPR